MKSALRISLKAGERIFVNGAVMRADRKVSLEFLNDVTFLLEHHVLQPEEATTPLRQLYFVAQLMIMSPEESESYLGTFRQSLARLLDCFDNEEVRAGLKHVDALVGQGRLFEALKTIRGLFPIEERILRSGGAKSRARLAGLEKEIPAWM